MTKEIRLII